MQENASTLETDIASDIAETREWLESLDYVLQSAGPGRVRELMARLQAHVRSAGVRLPFAANTPYINTIPPDKQPAYPGSHELEERIRNILRWNAMAMVVRANRSDKTIGGHIATYASVCNLYEVGFNHFFQGRGDGYAGDQIFFQAHSAPGIYARAFLEGRLSETHVENFRHEMRPGGGLSSYPHPWLMSSFWEFPTGSMGLSAIMAIYQARFNRYLEDRGVKSPNTSRVWAFLGDGETDEPEALGAITLAAREKLDNLTFVVNCNLQRLDGPVRGNGKIIQELEAAFQGAGWNVIKVIWGSGWDPLLAMDDEGLLVRRMGEIVDGQYQKYTVSDGKYQREHFFGVHPKLVEMSKMLTDEHVRTIRRGGHDTEKIYAAYRAAVEHKGAPTVVLAKTIKGYGMGEWGEGKNTAHQQKIIDEEGLRHLRTRFRIPLSDEEIGNAPFYRPSDDSPEIQYIRERRAALGGYVPSRSVVNPGLPVPPGQEVFEEFTHGTEGREVSTTMVFVRMLSKLLRDPQVGRLIVPIVPDEARTFGMEALFRQSGIYSHVGQLYEPVDKETLLYYKEAQDGQILEEGITEAGSLSSLIAAGTAYCTHGVNTIPFFIFYSMFGLQRVGDLVWAGAEMRTRGFLMGATSGRTTLNGEGLQHQDGHSHLLAYPIPNLLTYDPAYAYELAVIIRDGIRRMYIDQEEVFYYITVQNENYAMPAIPEGVEEGILKGLYRVAPAPNGVGKKAVAHLFGSGSILLEALKAQKMLAEDFGIAADVWSATSYKLLHNDALETDRWNMLHPAGKPKTSYIAQCLKDTEGVYVLASDYLKALPGSVARWIPGTVITLGTDGFGRSDSRPALRNFFEVDARFIALGALSGLVRKGIVKADVAQRAMRKLEIDPEKAYPVYA
ncbi:MAG: pyruvate dehydrogenase (acetyl-transferring), homodimeric type [candidate division Zixibacteria bacterium]|nr:pyruvate dehydrogenase (acetyl-transferring), homodimeric type [candidate division Zixibacteria bacterium]